MVQSVTFSHYRLTRGRSNLATEGPVDNGLANQRPDKETLEGCEYRKNPNPGAAKAGYDQS